MLGFHCARHVIDQALPCLQVTAQAAEQSKNAKLVAGCAAQHMQQTQHSQQQQQAARFEVIAEHADPAKQHADHAELQKLTQALREAEQRADAAELAVMTIQRTHTEAVEQSARLQARTAVCLHPFASLLATASS